MKANTNPNDLPVGITLGDPAGIGPELAIKIMGDRKISRSKRYVFIGNFWALTETAMILGAKLPSLNLIDRVEDSVIGFNLIEPRTLAKPDAFRLGKVQASCGQAAMEAIEFGAKGCLAGRFSGLVTLPIHKEAFMAAGFTDIGHQEVLGRIAGVSEVATMLMTPGLKVVHLSTHKSLIEAARYVKKDVLVEKLLMVHKTLEYWGLHRPVIGVAALNPHGGEGGLLGREELDEIGPAITELNKMGIDSRGPYPADSIFYRAIDGEFDVVLALYHDQGHIAIKVHNFHESTTATLGIPFIRTSVDHGTAFDIAGKGVADSSGLLAAIASAEALINRNLQSL
tara:strand:+ start:1833 stop:2852 length:1020 start_codon:yes stop_codon:yes gene_type:complete